ncbi:MAG: molecular chaperone DnaJ [Gemmatimonadota bacterium]
MADYYELLGVSRDADAEQIKRAYRQLAMLYHPDRNEAPEAEGKFRRVTEAYEILQDSEKRQLYDRYGEAGVKRNAGAPGGGFAGFDFSDAFEVFMREFGAGSGLGDLFRRAGTPRGPRRGGDVKLRVKVTLEEAARGAEKNLKVKVLSRCTRCSGDGAEPGTSRERCISCGGSGELRQMQRSLLGQFVTVRPCSECGGAGVRIGEHCQECRGDGLVRSENIVKVSVPAGVSTDDYLKLSGQGHAGPSGGPPGDILVLIEVEEDSRFERRGDDLVYNLAVTLSQAALGADVEVPTVIDGIAKLSVPAGVQGGQALRLRNKGMPRLRGSGRGDQIVRVLVWTPANLSREERAALERLAEVEQPAPDLANSEPGFWERVKRAFTA